VRSQVRRLSLLPDNQNERLSETGSEKRSGFDTSRPLTSFVEAVGSVLVSPRRFFADLEDSGTKRVKEPLIFALICGVLSFPLSFLAAPLDPLTPESPASISGFLSMQRENPGAALALAALLVLLLPFFAIAGVYISAVIQQLFVFIFVRERRGFRSTFAAIAYGGGVISLLSWIPILGYIATLYGIYVVAVGLKELHVTTTTRALLASAVPALLGLVGTLRALF
jgi:hypothetical protein